MVKFPFDCSRSADDHPFRVLLNSFLFPFVQCTHTFMCGCDIRYPPAEPLFHIQQPDVLGGCHILCRLVVLAADDEDTGLRLRRSEQPRPGIPAVCFTGFSAPVLFAEVYEYIADAECCSQFRAVFSGAECIELQFSFCPRRGPALPVHVEMPRVRFPILPTIPHMVTV